MKKFDDKSLHKFKEKFIEGYSKLFKVDDREYAEAVWNKLYAFSGYGFNRSHSAAYSLMGYWCQYLKVKYPLEFWASSLNFADEKTEIPNRLSEIEKTECGIDVKPPDVNKSHFQFTSDPETNSIYWSLTKIKGIGEIAAENIIESKGDGEFHDLGDFLGKVPKAKVNKKVVQILIMSGAFDEIGGENGLGIEEVKQRYKILQNHAQIVGCDLPKDVLESDSVNSNWFWSIKQKELTGFGFVNFPALIKMKNHKLKKFPYCTASDFEKKDLVDGLSWTPEKTGKPFTIAGRIHFMKERKSKNGNWIVRLSIESNNSLLNLGVFGDLYDDFREDFLELSKTKGLFCVNGWGLDTKPYGRKPNKGDSKNNELWLNKESKLIFLTKKESK